VIDPQNPHKLFAAMWSYRRQPWTFRSGGPGSGLYVTRNGGRDWRKLDREAGLPGGELGRIGLAIAPSDPSKVYAIVEARENVFLRSRDGGRSFETVAKGRDREGRLISGRPFYYADITVDPKDADRVYRIETTLLVSDDGGAKWTELVGWKVHPDHHALWIDEEDPEHLISGNDGGVAISTNHGKTWRFVTNLPFAQYYHVDVGRVGPSGEPYHVYGGLQDNGSWRGPSAVWENGGIRNHHWQELLFGDGFRTIPDAGDDRFGYAMSQQGYLRRWDRVTGQRVDIRPTHPEGTELRFAWNAALALDPHRAGGLWFGSQFVHYSPDRGTTWELRSPDLTTNRPEWQKQAESGGLTPDVTGAENFTTLLAIAPSPIDPQVVWVGSDDGRIHVSRDGGKQWQSVEKQLSGPPQHSWIPNLHASSHEAGRAFVVFDNHRRSDFAPYLYRTDDFGATWSSLVSEGLDGYLHVVVEDPRESRLVYAGGEFGLFVSINAGKNWTRMPNMPPAPVRGLAVQPDTGDLVVGTHGRGVFIYDDPEILRELARKAMPLQGEAQPLLRLLEPRPALQHAVRQTGSSRFPGDGEFRGENPPYGARLDVWIAAAKVDSADASRSQGEAASSAEAGDSKAKKKLVIRIRGKEDWDRRTLEFDALPGLNRISWDLRGLGPLGPGADKRGAGHRVSPGRYDVSVHYSGVSVQGVLEVRADPRLATSASGHERKRQALDAVRARLDDLGRMQTQLAELRKQLDEASRRLELLPYEKDALKNAGNEISENPLRDALSEFRKEVDDMEDRIRVRPRSRKGIQRNDSLSSEWWGIWGSLGSSDAAPTHWQLSRLEHAQERHAKFAKEFESWLREDFDKLRASLPQEIAAWLTRRSSASRNSSVQSEKKQEKDKQDKQEKRDL
jgi:photosystem II stability/assembly factor-like uncharacterized protein